MPRPTTPVPLADVLKPEGAPASRRERLISVLDWAAMLTSVISVSALPWLLGSVIPLARLVLGVGSVIAGLSCVAGAVLDRRRTSCLPLGAFLAVCMAAVGIVQLVPMHAPITSEMHHAVFPEFRMIGSDAGPDAGRDAGPEANRRPRSPRTTSPADTRFGVAQWLSLSLVFLTGFETLRSGVRLKVCLAILTANASLLATVGLLQRLDRGPMTIGAHWKLSAVDGFASFVNPNNAAGWLCIHLAAAFSLLYLEWKDGAGTQQPALPEVRRLTGTKLLGERFRDMLSQNQERLASLSIRQLLVLGAVLVNLAGIVAALSRSGLVAAAAGLIACLCWRIRRGRWLLLLTSVAVLATAFAAFLILTGLHEPVVAELSTLGDPVSELRVRLDHWRDSLQLLRDFPVLGSGLNAYRFSTLPYQKTSVGTWFCNADNQFVEVLVECGLAGGLLFFSLGFLSVWLLIRLDRASAVAKGIDGLQMSALVLILLVIVVTQSVCAMFDYGIGLPGNSAAIALLCGAATAPFSGFGLSGRRRRSAPEGRFVRWRSPGWISAMVQLVLIAATASFVPEQLAAHGIHHQAVAAERLLSDPHEVPSSAALNTIRHALTSSLVARPDDPLGLAALVRVQEAMCRMALIQSSAGDTEVPAADFRRLWNALTPTGLADTVLQAGTGKSTVDAPAVRNALTALLTQYPWVRQAEAATRRLPLAPGLTTDILASRLTTAPESVSDGQLLEILFKDPAGARRLFQTGHFCLLTGRSQPAIQLWQQSLNATEQYRRAILSEAATVFPPETVVRLFGPRDYVSSVRAADGIKAPELQELLWQGADQFWLAEAGQAASRPISLQRAVHLRHREGAAAAADWLGERLVEFPDDFEMRMLRARLLEQLGNSREAFAEWVRLEYFFPGNATVEKNIDRLNRLSVSDAQE